MTEHPGGEDTGTNGGDVHERVRVPRRQELPDVEATEIVKGTKPGSRFARRVREGDRRFARGEDEGTFRATERATAPRWNSRWPTTPNNSARVSRVRT